MSSIFRIGSLRAPLSYRLANSKIIIFLVYYLPSHVLIFKSRKFLPEKSERSPKRPSANDYTAQPTHDLIYYVLLLPLRTSTILPRGFNATTAAVPSTRPLKCQSRTKMTTTTTTVWPASAIANNSIRSIASLTNSTIPYLSLAGLQRNSFCCLKDWKGKIDIHIAMASVTGLILPILQGMGEVENKLKIITREYTSMTSSSCL